MKGIEVPNPWHSSACDCTCVLIRNRSLARDSLILAMHILFCFCLCKVCSRVSDAPKGLCNVPLAFRTNRKRSSFATKHFQRKSLKIFDLHPPLRRLVSFVARIIMWKVRCWVTDTQTKYCNPCCACAPRVKYIAFSGQELDAYSFQSINCCCGPVYQTIVLGTNISNWM